MKKGLRFLYYSSVLCVIVLAILLIFNYCDFSILRSSNTPTAMPTPEEYILQIDKLFVQLKAVINHLETSRVSSTEDYHILTEEARQIFQALLHLEPQMTTEQIINFNNLRQKYYSITLRILFAYE